jgi:hypothetical protein
MSKDLFMEIKEEELSKEETAISLETVENTYKFLGWENGWNSPIPELDVCHEAKHKRRFSSKGNRGHENTVSCDICKYYFKYDSSD